LPTVYFTVDSALLRELGERLVGKPYIALAELVKNGYDADAHLVTITLDTINGRISVVDNGQGMSEQEFNDFWMRVGSTHKEKQRYSRRLHRLMTGSKGVGRLAVQFLAGSLTIATTSENDLHKRLVANLTWEKAVSAGDLTRATVEYKMIDSSSGFSQGTTITLTDLKHQWAIDEIEGLASELWWLQPPFRNPTAVTDEQEKPFRIEFISPYPAYDKAFNDGMQAILNIWQARIVGRNNQGEVDFSLEFAGEEPMPFHFTVDKCQLKNGEWEIRVYNLRRRQPRKIKVDKAREYFNKFGGVHVYDGGFHLPYYGNPLNDWLGIEIDHSHRLTLSKLLPKELQVDHGLMFLPTNSRIFGEVRVNTSTEDDLKISITRDRLQEREAFRNLQFMIRYCLDLYAMEEKKRSAEAKEVKQEVQSSKFRTFVELIEKYEKDIPEEVFEELKEDFEETTEQIETRAEETAKQVSIIGPLATAGISSLAYQHELGKQFTLIEDIIEQLRKIRVPETKMQKSLDKLTEDLSTWVDRAKATNSLFSYFASAENTQKRERFRAKAVIEDVEYQLRALAKDTKFDLSELDDKMLLPKASLVEWGAIFQNVFINAFNALVDSMEKVVKVNSMVRGRNRRILIQDTGSGVNLEEAGQLFQPFVRRIRISKERRALGYGGMGLGLAIVRLIANNIGCEVAFVKPEESFSTAFCIRWSELE
jgi:signal transduction histidine kinase